MRITGGIYKGKLIQTIKGQDVRPTFSKIRESIFNIIRLSDSGTVFYEGKTIMLDLFAGSGIMGIEALSRGAEKSVFVEKNHRHSEIIKKNILNCVQSDKHQTKLMISDALKALSMLKEQFNFIFIDPPYASELYAPSLKKIQEAELLTENGFIILEHSSSLNINEVLEKTDFMIHKAKIYGDTGISVLIKRY